VRRGLWLWALVLVPRVALAIPDYCYEYNDQDHDGFVYGLTGAVCPREDCDDRDPAIYPGAAERCGDGVDQDCDGQDLPCGPVDADSDGHLPVTGGGDDCDDGDAAVHPGATEVCGDGKDNDCVGGDLACPQDADGDGFGAVTSGGLDCDDARADVHPHALEVCGDGVDQDCAAGDPPCAPDIDGDGYGNPRDGGDDCDDFDKGTHPGAAEVCGDGRDQDCDGQDLPCGAEVDADGDGHRRPEAAGDDCDDHAPSVYPGAAEVCDDDVDQDCDGRDLACGALSGDADGDGVLSFEAGGRDCNDNDAAAYPGAPEVCGDARDQDCDGRDAVLGVDAACGALAGADPAFEGAPAVTLGGAAAPGSCRAAGPADAAGWLAVGLWAMAAGRGRRRK
jgi:hypothetical protein